MQVKTKTMGVLEISEEQVVHIPAGLFGFADYHDFALIDSKVKPLIWLQSLDESGLAFLLIDPFLIRSDYEADIDDEELAKIGIKEPSDVLLMAIITAQEGMPVTANLRGPLIINKRNHECMQAILSDPTWTTKHDIVASLAQEAK